MSDLTSKPKKRKSSKMLSDNISCCAEPLFDALEQKIAKGHAGVFFLICFYVLMCQRFVCARMAFWEIGQTCLISLSKRTGVFCCPSGASPSSSSFPASYLLKASYEIYSGHGK